MKKNKLIKIIALGVLFFLVLIYKTFPYDLIKDNINKGINKAIQKEHIPLIVNIGSLKPYWITGIELNNIEIKNALDNASPLLLDEVIIKFSLLPLLIGHVSTDIIIYQVGGTAYTSASVSLIDAFSGILTLKSIDIFLTRFPLGEIFSQFLGVIRSSNKAEYAVLTPVISKTTLGGNLNGKIKYREKYGKINLTLEKAFLNISNETLNIPKQDFSKAAFNLKWDGKRYAIDNNTELQAQNVSIKAGGFWETSKNPSDPTHINLEFKINMSGVIEKDFGFLIPQFLNCSPTSLINGKMNISLVGDAHNFACH
ncbi:hypothetical protein [Fluviispira sanaruensis]|uniref:Type II secretion system protein GspN n=1 Tax=Fluviispira sanaruensis TaxID=2493639 RepID=A0A4P2VTM2_FLUSA|nr:hypothetical protein [Fluviispira sanaruensis]BBH52222.1 hypothetical protein JCM31447_06620 [Fluviispira sanaruensis]